jgi:hypothetical protein
LPRSTFRPSEISDQEAFAGYDASSVPANLSGKGEIPVLIFSG